MNGDISDQQFSDILIDLNHDNNDLGGPYEALFDVNDEDLEPGPYEALFDVNDEDFVPVSYEALLMSMMKTLNLDPLKL